MKKVNSIVLILFIALIYLNTTGFKWARVYHNYNVDPLWVNGPADLESREEFKAWFLEANAPQIVLKQLLGNDEQLVKLFREAVANGNFLLDQDARTIYNLGMGFDEDNPQVTKELVEVCEPGVKVVRIPDLNHPIIYNGYSWLIDVPYKDLVGKICYNLVGNKDLEKPDSPFEPNQPPPVVKENQPVVVVVIIKDQQQQQQQQQQQPVVIMNSGGPPNWNVVNGYTQIGPAENLGSMGVTYTTPIKVEVKKDPDPQPSPTPPPPPPTVPTCDPTPPPAIQDPQNPSQPLTPPDDMLINDPSSGGSITGPPPVDPGLPPQENIFTPPTDDQLVTVRKE